MHSQSSNQNNPAIQSQANLSETEGWLSLLVGGALVILGLTRKQSLLALAGGALSYRGLTRHCPVYQAAGVDRSEDTNERTATVTIQRSAEEVYAFCSDMRNFPQFVSFLQEVHVEQGNQYRWTVEPVTGKRFHFSVELFEQSEPRAVRWRTLDDAPLRVEGSLEFEAAPANRGTRVRATADFRNHNGLLSGLAKKLAKHKLRHDLGQLKQILEAGEVISIEGQPSGRSHQPSRGVAKRAAGTQEIRGAQQHADAAAH